jgi:hypothetical protein
VFILKLLALRILFLTLNLLFCLKKNVSVYTINISLSSYCYSTYRVADPFSSLGTFSSSSNGGPVFHPIADCEHPLLCLPDTGIASQETAISGHTFLTQLNLSQNNINRNTCVSNTVSNPVRLGMKIFCQAICSSSSHCKLQDCVIYWKKCS